MGCLRYFLGIEVAYSRDGISLSQRKYVLDILSEVGFLRAKPVNTPMDPNVKLSAFDDSRHVDPFLYRKLVGLLIWFLNTQPNINFSMGLLAGFMSNPLKTHWQARLCIL